MILCNRRDPEDVHQLRVRNLCCVQHRVLSLQDPLDCDHIRPGHLLWLASLWIDFHREDVVDERVLCDLGPGGMSHRGRLSCEDGHHACGLEDRTFPEGLERVLCCGGDETLAGEKKKYCR